MTYTYDFHMFPVLNKEARNKEAEKKIPTNHVVFRVEARHLRLRDEVVNEGQENQQPLGFPRCQGGKMQQKRNISWMEVI